MIDKIKALSDKTMIIIGLTLIIISSIFYIVATYVCFANGITFIKGIISFIFYALSATGFAFMMMAYKKKLKNKQG